MQEIKKAKLIAASRQFAPQSRAFHLISIVTELEAKKLLAIIEAFSVSRELEDKIRK